MSLKLGPLPNGKVSNLKLTLSGEDADALHDYAAIHAEQYGKPTAPSELAALMVRQFLKKDAAFQRARKQRYKASNGKE